MSQSTKEIIRFVNHSVDLLQESIKDDLLKILQRQNPLWDIKELDLAVPLHEHYVGYLSQTVNSSQRALDQAVSDKMTDFEEMVIAELDVHDPMTLRAANGNKTTIPHLANVILNLHLDQMKRPHR